LDLGDLARILSEARGIFERSWRLFVIEFAASCRDCHCGRTLQALILGDPLALNVRLKTEISGQVATLFFRHGSANRTIEIERRIISHLGSFTAFSACDDGQN
jgi:hypothetical protein